MPLNLTNEQLEAFDKQFRRDYLKLKASLIEDIVSRYVGAVSFVADEYRRSPYRFFDGTNISREGIASLNAAINQTYRPIYNVYNKSISRIAENAVLNVRMPLEIRGALPDSVRFGLGEIPSTLALQHLNLPRDTGSVDVLKRLGVFNALDIKPIRGMTVAGSEDIYNRMFEHISRELTGKKQMDALQALVNVTPKTPVGQSVINTVQSLYDIKKQAQGFSLSERIWPTEKRVDILSTILDGAAKGKSPAEIAENLKQYATTGRGFKVAFRLAYTELTAAFSSAKTQAAADWNNDPEADFQLAIYQYLASTHYEYDICDVHEGYYLIDDEKPPIPRHPHCNCGERLVRIDRRIMDMIKKTRRDVKERLKTYEELRGQPVKVGRTYIDPKTGLPTKTLPTIPRITGKERIPPHGADPSQDITIKRGKLFYKDKDITGVLNSDETHFLKAKTDFYEKSGGGVLGSYYDKENRFWFFKEAYKTETGFKETLLHEIGHSLDYFWGKQSKVKYVGAYKDNALLSPMLSRTGTNSTNIYGDSFRTLFEGDGVKELYGIMQHRLRGDLNRHLSLRETEQLLKQVRVTFEDGKSFAIPRGWVQYATSPSELFAEAYKNYRLYPRQMKRFAPKTFEFMENVTKRQVDQLKKK